MAILNQSNFFAPRCHRDQSYKNNNFLICSESEFIAILKRERERSDRTGQEFSLLIFNPGPEKTDEKKMKLLLRSLIRRLRSIDEAGWMKAGRIGVLLPGAALEGANGFAETIQEQNRDTLANLEYDVLHYPEDCPADLFSRNQRPADIRMENPGRQNAREDGRAVRHETPPPSPSENRKRNSLFQRGNGNGFPSIRTFCVRNVPLWKRSMDIIGSFLGLFIVSPLFLFISALIKTASPGPVFFKQERIGYGGKPFTLYKFRTMKCDSDPGCHKQYLSELINSSIQCSFEKPMNKLDDDPRIIPFGHFLRKSCLDELPQLINVFLGHMSLVGPRPPIQYEVDEYIDWHKERLDILPGMTGLWQVNGKNNLTFKQMVSLDIQYIKKLSLWFDLEILLKTPMAIIGQLADRQLSSQLDPKDIKQNA